MADPDLMMQLVKRRGGDLQYGSLAIRDNELIVRHAVQQDAMALQFASERLQCCKELVLDAVRNDPRFRMIRSSPAGIAQFSIAQASLSKEIATLSWPQSQRMAIHSGMRPSTSRRISASS